MDYSWSNILGQLPWTCFLKIDNPFPLSLSETTNEMQLQPHKHQPEFYGATATTQIIPAKRFLRRIREK